MKCLYHNDLIFCEVCTTIEEELILDETLKWPGDNAKTDDAKYDHAQAQAEGSSDLEELLIEV